MNKLLSFIAVYLFLISCESKMRLPSTEGSAKGPFNQIDFNTAVELRATDPYKSLDKTIYVDGERDALQIHVINAELTLGIAFTNLETTAGSNGFAFLNINDQWESQEVFIKVLEEGTPSYFDYENEGYRFGNNFKFSVEPIYSDSRLANDPLIIEAPYFP
jgi:hypothetical protein